MFEVSSILDVAGTEEDAWQLGLPTAVSWWNIVHGIPAGVECWV